jgi:polyphosphate kinase
VPGISDEIRVVSVVGRFLEHSRIYRFENAGTPELFIGSSDLRPRNLRRRVELLVPVRAPSQRTQLEGILRLYLNDGTGWVLGTEGSYERSSTQGPSAQATLAAARTFTPSASRTVVPIG